MNGLIKDIDSWQRKHSGKQITFLCEAVPTQIPIFLGKEEMLSAQTMVKATPKLWGFSWIEDVNSPQPDCIICQKLANANMVGT